MAKIKSTKERTVTIVYHSIRGQRIIIGAFEDASEAALFCRESNSYISERINFFPKQRSRISSKAPEKLKYSIASVVPYGALREL